MDIFHKNNILPDGFAALPAARYKKELAKTKQRCYTLSHNTRSSVICTILTIFFNYFYIIYTTLFLVAIAAALCGYGINWLILRENRLYVHQT